MSHEIAPATMKELRGVLVRWAIVLGVLGAFATWATWRMSTAAERVPAADGPAAAVASRSGEPTIDYWTCTMHPEVQLSDPGDCPICGMELVPKYSGSDEPGVKPAREAAASTVALHGHVHGGATPGESEQPAWYRCTMPECGDQGSSDPESRCPVCGMKRELIDAGGEGSGEFEIKLGERARRLAEVETEPAAPRLLHKRIRTVGRVGYDETRYKMASAWIDGRIDKLYADFTGMMVSQGDHLVEIYSPELLSAQEEYLQALRAVAATRDSHTAVSRRSSEQVVNSAKRKLELLGVSDAQILAVEQSGVAQTNLVLHAPIGGTIVEKRAMEGMYVKTGDALYTIADLTHLWLIVELYESDLPWVKPFQEVRVTTRSLPGKVFTGEIVFIDPRVAPRTRTVSVRIHLENAAMRLKPDMWVTAQIDTALSRGGDGAVPAPRGAYVCPMHPWEAEDQPDICSICEMDMVRVESLPQYATATDPASLLSVPRDAVMQTGERALVYVESSSGVYRGVEVTVGPLAHGDDGREYYPILAGLSGDERVVTRGNFAIDSQMQLAGKPSLFAARGFVDRQNEKHAPRDIEPTAPENADAADSRQTICPVMGNEINPEVFIEYKGVKVYFCCWGCDDKFRADPEKCIPKLPATVQERIRAAENAEQATPESEAGAQQTMCPVMGGEIVPDVFTDYRGVRIYFCCPPCIETFTADPEKYIAELPAAIQAKIARQSVGEASDD